MVVAGGDECDSPLLAIDHERFDEAEIPTGWIRYADDKNAIMLSDAGLHAQVAKSGEAVLYRDFVGVAHRADVAFTLTLRGDASSASVGCYLILGKESAQNGPGVLARLALEGSVIRVSVSSHSSELGTASQAAALAAASSPVGLTLSMAGAYVIGAGATTMGTPAVQTVSIPWDAASLPNGLITCGLSGVFEDDGGGPLDAVITDLSVRICR
jgi:hypothetical protein